MNRKTKTEEQEKKKADVKQQLVSPPPSVMARIARHQVLSVAAAPERHRPEEAPAATTRPGAQGRDGHGRERRGRRARDEVSDGPAHGPRGVVAACGGAVLSEVERGNVEALGAAVFHVSGIAVSLL